MKSGNLYSELLDNFTENYAKVAQMILSRDSGHKFKNEHKVENEPELAGYDDFLDKFARKQAKDVVKAQTFRFLTTESNRDNYHCELILRKLANHYKLKLTHYAGILDYAALQSVWKFAETEEKLAKSVFDTLVYALDGIKTQHNANTKHPTSLAPIIREAIKPIAEANQYRKQILSLDESDLQRGENDWQQTIYASRYPEYQEETKQEMFSGKHKEEAPIKRTAYTGRNSKTTQEI